MISVSFERNSSNGLGWVGLGWEEESRKDIYESMYVRGSCRPRLVSTPLFQLLTL